MMKRVHEPSSDGSRGGGSGGGSATDDLLLGGEAEAHVAERER